MIPTSHPRLADLPSAPDVVVIGAGAAGIAAARHCCSAGLATAVLEARPRIGGRAVTVSLAGHPVDLGAHWLHAGKRNPLVALAARRGERVRSAAQQGRHLRVGRGPATPADQEAYGQAWERADEAYGAFTGPDRAFAEVLPALGPWRRVIESTEVLLSGRPLAEVSFADQPGDALYEDNHFIEGGYGAYLARLAEGLPIRTGCPVLSVDWSGDGVVLDTPDGPLCARAAIVAVPVTLLQPGGLRFSPPLPDETAEAIGRFLVGTYEHVVLRWPDCPLEGPDRFATLIGGPHGATSLLTRIDGSDLHYMELNHEMIEAIGPDPAGRQVFAERILRDFFTEAELSTCEAILATDWRADPWSLGSWAVLPPGAQPSRDVLTRAVGDRIWFAGEALAGPQWGTVGGAWEHGERAAAEVVKLLS